MGDASSSSGKPSRRGLPFILELPLLIVVALAVAVLIKTFLLQAFWIPSSSMVPTLEVEDRVLVSKLDYRFGQPEPGDVVVFESPYGGEGSDESLLALAGRTILESLGIRTAGLPEDFIKRVIAGPGQTVEILDNRVVVDGLPLLEPYVASGSAMSDRAEELVPEGHLWVMGDNRNHSSDSRVFGPIPIDEVVGRAFVLMWPLDRWRGL